VHRVGQLLPRRLTDQAVLNPLQKRAIQAGVAPFSPHDFRRTFISELLDAGVDIEPASFFRTKGRSYGRRFSSNFRPDF
jgi:integrase